MCAKILMADGSEIRGKIGGKVYSRNASGAFVRKYVKPINANTAKQQSVRNTFGSLSSAYRTLSDAERATYENMRQFYKTQDSIGNTITPTAAQLFNRLNGVLVQNGVLNIGSILTTCPTPVPIVGITAGAPDYNTGTNTFNAALTFDNATDVVPTGQKLIISATPAISAGIKKVPANLYTRITTLDAGDDTGTENLHAAYTAVYPEPSAGDNVYLKAQTFVEATGQITSEVTFKVAVS